MREKIFELFEKTKAEAVLLRNSSSVPEQNFFYFSKLPYGHFSGSFLLLMPEKKPLLITSILEKSKNPGLVTKNFSTEARLKKILLQELKGTKKIGLNFDLYPKNSFSRLKKILPEKTFVDASKALVKIRETKTRGEISRIEKAVKISEKAIERLPDFFKKGMTEKQIALALEAVLREKGDNDLAFPTIAASGKNSSGGQKN